MTELDDHDYKPEVSGNSVSYVPLHGPRRTDCFSSKPSAGHFAATLRGDEAKAAQAEVGKWRANSAEWFAKAEGYLLRLDAKCVEMERLTADRDAAFHKVDSLEDTIERLTAERDDALAELDRCRWALDGHHGRVDPDAPPILCERVGVAVRDGEMVPMFEATGRQVRKLGPEWECLNTYKGRRGCVVWRHCNGEATPSITYLVRRVAAPEPAAPKTERVPWQKCIGRTRAVNGRVINGAFEHEGQFYFTTYGWAGHSARVPADGMVEVLTEDGAS